MFQSIGDVQLQASDPLYEELEDYDVENDSNSDKDDQ